MDIFYFRNSPTKINDRAIFNRKLADVNNPDEEKIDINISLLGVKSKLMKKININNSNEIFINYFRNKLSKINENKFLIVGYDLEILSFLCSNYNSKNKGNFKIKCIDNILHENKYLLDHGFINLVEYNICNIFDKNNYYVYEKYNYVIILKLFENPINDLLTILDIIKKDDNFKTSTIMVIDIDEMDIFATMKTNNEITIKDINTINGKNIIIFKYNEDKNIISTNVDIYSYLYNDSVEYKLQD